MSIPSTLPGEYYYLSSVVRVVRAVRAVLVVLVLIVRVVVVLVLPVRVVLYHSMSVQSIRARTVHHTRHPPVLTTVVQHIR
jgi:hypothetical protein